MTDKLNENMLTINNKTETPQTPLNEPKNENDPTPGEVILHNETNKCEKKEESTQFKNAHEKQKQHNCNRLFDVILNAVRIFLILNNCFPFVIAIIEVIRREMYDLDFHYMPAIEIVLYVIIFYSLIKALCCRSGYEEFSCAFGSFFLFIAWLIDIISYFKDMYIDEIQPEEKMELFIKIKIYGCITVIGIDISFIIFANCC